MRLKTVGFIVLTLAVLGLATYWLARWSPGPVQLDSGYQLVMGTFGRIVVIAPNHSVAKRALEAALARQQRIEALMSFHNPSSELSRLNEQAYHEPVQLSEETFEVIARSLQFSKLTDGAFDITVGVLEKLWADAAQSGRVPSPEQLQQARSKLGWQKVHLDAAIHTIRFATEGMKLDLGGIAKGYAIDESIEAMRKAGASAGMVDIGGDIRCFGIPPQGGGGWRIGLQRPEESPEPIGPGEPVLVLQLTDMAVATSGNYRRFVVVAGQKHSHILNTRTGQSCDKLASVTIIAKEAITADALATAVSVLGLSKGLALIEAADGIEAIIIPSADQPRIVYSSGAARYVEPPVPTIAK